MPVLPTLMSSAHIGLIQGVLGTRRNPQKSQNPTRPSGPPMTGKVETMKMTKRQALKLFDIVSASCALDQSIGGWTTKTRLELVNEIINQQDEDLELREGNGQDGVIREMRRMLRDEGIVNQSMGPMLPLSVNTGTASGGDKQKAAYDW